MTKRKSPRRLLLIGEAGEIKQEMVGHIQNVLPDTDDLDIESAIWWFANDYHEGQFHPLYEILSISPFSPGPSHRSVEDEGEIAEMIYSELEARFTKPG